jgi:GTP:adenosylcobinamide-phosphate guanylyltransferase
LAIGGVQFPLDSFVVTESSVLRTNFWTEKPAHRQSDKNKKKKVETRTHLKKTGLLNKSGDYVKKMKKIIKAIIIAVLFLSSSIICVAQKKISSIKNTKTVQKAAIQFLPAEFFGKWVTSVELCSFKYKECDEEGEPFIIKKSSTNGVEMSGPRWHSKIYKITKISENCYKINYRELHCELDSSNTSIIITLKGTSKLLVDYGTYKEEYILCQ